MNGLWVEVALCPGTQREQLGSFAMMGEME